MATVNLDIFNTDEYRNELLLLFKEKLDGIYEELTVEHPYVYKIIKTTVRANKLPGIKKIDPKKHNVCVNINGKYVSFLYKSSADKNLFKSYQLDNYKFQCNQLGIEYIYSMFNTLVCKYWATLTNTEKEEHINEKRVVDLIGFFKSINSTTKRREFFTCSIYADMLN